ncbi:MAG TPA: hypothetical protein ACYCDB_00330 [Candidatus Azoamicus sp.]
MLGEIINLISIIRKRLELIKSKYSIIFSMIELLSKVKPDYEIVEKVIKKDKEIDLISNIDEEWEEKKIF